MRVQEQGEKALDAFARGCQSHETRGVSTPVSWDGNLNSLCKRGKKFGGRCIWTYSEGQIVAV